MQTFDRQKRKKKKKQDSRNQDNFGYSGVVKVSYPSPLMKTHPLRFSRDILEKSQSYC